MGNLFLVFIKYPLINSVADSPGKKSNLFV